MVEDPKTIDARELDAGGFDRTGVDGSAQRVCHFDAEANIDLLRSAQAE